LLAEFAFAEPMQQNVFRYNVSVNDGVDNYAAFTIWGGDSDSIAASAVFHNNTAIVDSNVASGSRGTLWFVNENHHEIDLINNLFVALNGAALIDGTSSVDQARFVNNAYWTGDSPVRIGDEIFADIAEWAAASQQEMLEGQFVGVQADPLLGSLSSYRPEATSPLIDAGLSAGGAAWPAWLMELGPTDIDGVPLTQGAGLDIGAAEYLPLPGDYNGDASVDAADYVIWRRSLDQVGSGLAADGNRNGRIDAGDYAVWRMHFGQPSSSGASTAATRDLLTQSIPEPASVLLLVLTFVAIPGIRSNSRRRQIDASTASPDV